VLIGWCIALCKFFFTTFTMHLYQGNVNLFLVKSVTVPGRYRRMARQQYLPICTALTFHLATVWWCWFHHSDELTGFAEWPRDRSQVLALWPISEWRKQVQQALGLLAPRLVADSPGGQMILRERELPLLNPRTHHVTLSNLILQDQTINVQLHTFSRFVSSI